MGIHTLTTNLRTIKKIIKIFPKAFGGYSKKIFVLTILGFVTGLLEGVGVTILIPLVNFFEAAGREPSDLISRTVKDIFDFLNIPFTLPVVLIFIVVLFFMKFVAIMIHEYFSARIFTRYEKNLTDKLFRNFLKANWPYLLKQKLGRLETLVKIDASQSGKMLYAVSTFLMIGATLFAYLLVAVNISETVTIAALGFGALVLILYKPLFSLVKRLSHEVSQLNAIVSHHISESLLGIKTIKALGAEERLATIGEKFFERLRWLQLRELVFSRAATEFIQPLGILFITLTVAFAFYQTSYNLGALAALVYLIHRIFQYTQRIQGVVHQVSTALPYVENVVSYLDETTRAREQLEVFSGQTFKFNDALEFKNVSFAYHNRDRALKEVDFTIKKGEMVGIIGPSGAGKTTIFDVILRFLEPQSGEVFIDGQSIKSVDIAKWRRGISYVSQDVFILNDTISNNIRFFDPSIRSEDIERVAKMAGIFDFIEDLPKKFQSETGERGNFLSAGQKQRIALARVLARQPEILLLDEATSALDNESEQKIQKIIRDLKGKVTVLVIAHRLSTVLDADKLLVIEKGQVIEEGEPKKLLKDKRTYFYKTYNLRA